MRLNNDSRRLLETATVKYEKALDLAMPYLEGRGIKISTARSLRLGYVVEPEVGHESYVGRLSLPYLTRGGVVGMKFRAVDGSDPKYLCSQGFTPHLFNVEALFDRSATIALTEGELDAAVLSYQCGIPAVGCPGVSTWRDHFPRLFAGYDRVFIYADGDQPGREFAKRVANDLDNAVILAMPDGMDVNQMYVLEGPEALRKRAGLE